jgi:hypothetical protein
MTTLEIPNVQKDLQGMANNVKIALSLGATTQAVYH